MPNYARFTIQGTPSSPGGYDATPGATLTFALEAGPASIVQTWELEVHDPGNPGSPLASKGAPLLTLVGAASGQRVKAATPNAEITSAALPAGATAHSWIVRSLVNGGKNARGHDDPDFVFERMIVLRAAGGRRKVVAAESTQYSSRGWADAQNDDVDALIASVARGADLADADQTLTFTALSQYVQQDGTLTATRTKTLDPTGLSSAHAGLMARIVRLDGSAHDLVVANGGAGGAAEGTTQKTLPGGAPSVADFKFDGTDFQFSGFAWLA